MLVYFTGTTDTPALIARKFAGRDHPSLAKWIYRANVNTQAHRLIPGTDLYASRRPIVIPVCPVLPPEKQRWQAFVLRKLDWLSPPARHNLYRAQQAGLDINHLLLSHELVREANHYTEDASIGLTLGFQAFEVATDLKTERLSKFRDVLLDTKNTLKTMATAPDDAARAAAHSRFGQDLQRLNAEFKREMVEFDLRGKALLRNPKDAIKVASEKGWQIFDIDILNNVERAARALRFAGRFFAVADAASGVWQTWEAYREGADWFKIAMRESADLGSMIVTARTVKGILAGFEITPEGWAATLAVGAVTAGINYLVDSAVINPLIDEYF